MHSASRARAAAGVDLVQVGDDLLHRSVQAVEIQTVEAGLPLAVRLGLAVVAAQPVDEVANHGVAPHPRREPLESTQRFVGGGVLAQAAHVAVDPVGVWPVGLGGDRTESLLLDQPFRDRGARLVELVRAV